MTEESAAVRQYFGQWYLGGIAPMINNDSAFLSFVCMVTGVDALAGYRYEGSKKVKGVENRFTAFVREYFPSEYHGHASALYDLRNGLVHAFSPRGFLLTHHNGHQHLKVDQGTGQTLLNAEDLFAALVQASRAFFADVETKPEMERALVARFQSKGGGGVGVVPVRTQ